MNSVFTRKLAALTIIGAVTAGCSGEPFSQEPRVIQSTLERNRVEVRFPGSEILATASCFQGAVVLLAATRPEPESLHSWLFIQLILIQDAMMG